MPSLASVADNFLSDFTTSDGIPVEGTIFAAREGSTPGNDYSTARLWFRVPMDTPEVDIRTQIIDPFGRRFVLGDHDYGLAWNEPLYRIFRAIRVTPAASWTRMQKTTDTLTGLAKATTPLDMGPLYCSIEPGRSAQFDLVIHVQPNATSIVTGQDIQLGDKINGMVVTRLNPVLGILLAEAS